MSRDKRNQFGRLWTFRTRRFTVSLILEQDYGYQYDGDDEDGEVQAKLDSGDFVAFDSKVSVELDGVEIAADYLGGSVYADTQDFVCEHYGLAAKSRADGCNYGAYFPGMVRQAISEAREYVRNMEKPPRIRESA
jgi:hypothetical protein